MRRERRHSLAGYSLVELVVALSIFSMGVLGVLELFGTCLQASSASLGYTQAVFLAQQLMEETIAEGTFSTMSDNGDYGERYPRHSWQLEVEETNRTGLYQIRAIINWTERGVDKEYTLTTLAAERS